jgi:tetrahydromethanopterin S-methyltransferase subunit G
MTENVESLILEHLKMLRNEVKAQGVKMDEQFESIRLRLSSIESQMAGIHADIAIMNGRMDRFESRLDRIERRLELVGESG